MARTFSAGELAAEAGLPVERIEWLVRLGILKPREPGPFRFGDVFRAKLAALLLAARIAEAAGPGEVLVSEAVVEAVDLPQLRFDPTDRVELKGVPEPVVLCRVRVA